MTADEVRKMLSECDNCGPERVVEARRGVFVNDEQLYFLAVRCPKCGRVWGKLVRDQRRKGTVKGDSMSREQRAIMRVDLGLFRNLLQLPDNVEIQAIHVGLDEFARAVFAVKLAGTGLPVGCVESGTRLPEVTAVYRSTQHGPEFVQLKALEPPHLGTGEWDCQPRDTSRATRAKA